MIVEQETLDEVMDDATVHEARRLVFSCLKESLKTEREGEKQEKGLLDQKAVSLMPLLAGVTWEKGLDGAAPDYARAKLAYERAGEDPKAARAISKLYQFGLGMERSDDDAATIWRNLSDHLVELKKLRAGVEAIGTDELQKYVSDTYHIRYDPFVAIDPDIKIAVDELLRHVKRSKGLILSTAQEEALATELGEVFTSALLDVHASAVAGSSSD